MAPCRGATSPIRAHSVRAGLCPEKLVKLTKLSLQTVCSPAVKGKGLTKGILPLQAFTTVSLIPAGIHPDKILH